METLAFAAEVRNDTVFAPRMKMDLPANQLEPALTQLFLIEYQNFQKILRVFGTDEWKLQRLALETVKPALDDVHGQLNEAVRLKVQLTNGNLVWYIQKMVELRTTAVAWAKGKGLIH